MLNHAVLFRRLLILVLLPGRLLTAGPAGLAWKIGPDEPASQFNSEDADAGVVKEGGTLWVQASLWPHWRRFRGPDMDHLSPLPEARRDASFSRPHGDDAYWSDGIWEDGSGKFHAIVHIEYDYSRPRKGFLWRRRIGLATSDDHGANWHYEGDILTTNPKRPGRPSAGFTDFGCGDTYLFVDRRNGYFYLYYLTAWVDGKSGARADEVMSVARCPMSAGMAPGAWKKWNGGEWAEPGIGGTEAPIFTDADSAVIHFNSYLNAYVAIGRNSDGSAWIATCPTLSAQDWQPRDYDFPRRLYWYNWPIDPITGDRYEIGQNLRVYSSEANVNGVGSKYMNIQFSFPARGAAP